MRNRETINRKLEQIESNLTKMVFVLKRQGTREEFETLVDNTKDLAEQIKAFISMEPISPNEINKLN
jgi:hypothetical protein